MKKMFDEPKTWWEYVEGHIPRLLFVIVCDTLMLRAILWIGANRSWYDDSWTWKYLGWPSIIVYMVMLAMTLMPLLHYWQLRKDAKERMDTKHRRHVIEQMGVDEDVKVPVGLRLKHAVRASAGTLFVAGLVEAFILGVIAYNEHEFTFGNVEAKVMVSAVFLLSIPLWAAVSLWKDVTTPRKASNARARVEYAYRAAVVDKEDLAGGLVLDAHVRSGGELTVQQEAGGLEVHEEVVLDLDALEESIDHVLDADAAVRRS